MKTNSSSLQKFCALFQIQGSRLTSLKGDVGLFFEYLSPDLEQVDQGQAEEKLLALENDLLTQDIGPWIKIYSLNGRTFANCAHVPKLGEAQVIINEKPLEEFAGGNPWGDVEFYEDYLTVGGGFWRIISMKNPPSSLVENSLPSYGDFILCLKRLPTVEARAKLDFRRRIHFSGLFKGIRDIAGENAYKEAEATLEGLTDGSRALFACEVFFILKSSTKLGLDESTSHFLDSMQALDCPCRVESRALSYFFQTLVPGVAPSFKRSMLVTSDYLTGLFPFQRDQLLEEGLQLKARSGSDLNFNLFSPVAHNYNVLITGSSGQGKSMLANKILRHELESGAKVLCLDLGNSFRKNALFGEGLIFSEKFNPLQFQNPRYLKEFILAVLDEKLSKKDEGRLFESIRAICESKIQSFDQFLLDLEKHFQGIGHSFAEIREYFCDDVSPENKFIYCDLGNYPDSIKAPLVIFLIECFKNMQGRKVFIFDECWNLLLKNADYIAECFRTFRKHEASAVAISQNLDDFSETQLGRVIIQNTYFKFFFKQNLKTSEFISEHLAGLVASVYSKKGEYSEFVVASEMLCKPARFYPTSLEYEIFTSDRKDLNHFEQYMSEKGKFLPYPSAITNYTKIKHPHWRPV